MNSTIAVMVNGLPGKMARAVAEAVVHQPDQFSLVPFSLTGAEVPNEREEVAGVSVQLIPPAKRTPRPGWVAPGRRLVAVDFTVPSAVEGNVAYYCEQGWPFVLGTTGGDDAAVRERVARSPVCAVAAPNMSVPVLLWVAALEYLSETFPGALAGWEGEIVESHQAGKKDTSGTAKLMVRFLQRLGINVDVERIVKVRDPYIQRSQLKVPEAYLGGHAYHNYRLRSPDGTVQLGLSHEVLGRQTYVEGALRAVRFVAERSSAGIRGRTYSMQEILRAGGQSDG